MTPYYLCRDVFFCSVDGHFVFLDLKRDRYLSLDSRHAAAFRLLLDNNKQPNPSESKGSDCRISATLSVNTEFPDTNLEDMQEAIDDLVNQGLITEQENRGKVLLPLTIDFPSKDLVGYCYGETLPIKFHHFLSAFIASLNAVLRLRLQPLDRVVRQVKRRKLRSAKTVPEQDVRRLRGLIEIFRRLRPLLFTADDQCLFEALALLKFLSSYKLYPDWMFGVKMGPFGAHCWIQHQGVVCNDSVAHISSYTPIMVV